MKRAGRGRGRIHPNHPSPCCRIIFRRYSPSSFRPTSFCSCCLLLWGAPPSHTSPRFAILTLSDTIPPLVAMKIVDCSLFAVRRLLIYCCLKQNKILARGSPIWKRRYMLSPTTTSLLIRCLSRAHFFCYSVIVVDKGVVGRDRRWRMSYHGVQCG